MPDKKLLTVRIKSEKSGKEHRHQLGWEYTSPKLRFSRITPGQAQAPTGPRMELGHWQELNRKSAKAEDQDRFAIGAPKSFVPNLGPMVDKPNPEDPFHSYIYKNEEGKLIGVIRIASYSPEDPELYVEKLKQRLKHFSGVIDGLVIDQNSNPGGQFFLAYAIASMLTEHALATPKHKIALRSERIQEAQDTLARMAEVKDDQSAREAFGDTWSGFPVTYDFAQKYAEYSRFILKEFEAGKRLSDPVHLDGVDKINPDAEVRITVPIVMLINELDFSNGDFFPAIFQDNKRAVLLGTPTAGAGGFVESFHIPNYLGIDQFRITGSVGVRPDGSYIETVGVQPDVPYTLSEKDLRNDFQDYAAKINAVMSAEIKKAEAALAKEQSTPARASKPAKPG